MAGRTTDRKGKGKDQKTAANEPVDALANFTLPDSLPCSEIEFPVVIKKANKANWQEILEESAERHREIDEYAESKRESVPKSPFLKTKCDFIKNEVFVHLLPALEETLNKAKIWEALSRQKCFFNGIDHIVQVLWNNNPRHPERKFDNHHLFNMPWVRQYLKEKVTGAMQCYVGQVLLGRDLRTYVVMKYCYRQRIPLNISPRPYYPKSWLWPEEYAATLIQKTVRQYFVQREDEVQEMRDFWKKLEVERQIPDMDTNPFLAKRFASEPNFRKNP